MMVSLVSMVSVAERPLCPNTHKLHVSYCAHVSRLPIIFIYFMGFFFLMQKLLILLLSKAVKLVGRDVQMLLSACEAT